MKYHLYLDGQAVESVDFGTLVQLVVSGAITRETQITADDLAAPNWKRLDAVFPSLVFLRTRQDVVDAVAESRAAGGEAIRIPKPDARQGVVVEDLQIKFGSLVRLLIKIAFAAIPAWFFLMCVSGLTYLLLNAIVKKFDR